MNRCAKMMLMRSGIRQGERERDRRDYRGPESRFRDRDGREHYDDDRYAPMSRGGEHPRGEYMEPYSHYPMSPYVPPMYRDDGQRMGYRHMSKIGFSMGGEMEHIPQEYGQDHHMGSGHDSGQMWPQVMPIFNRQMAEDWVRGMRNSDGTKGPHWTIEKTREIQKQYGIDCDEVEFWAVINSLYSDYCEALKKSNASTLETYACLAKAWIEDGDAVPNKAAAYFTYVVER